MWVKAGQNLGGTAAVRYPDGSRVVITSGEWRTGDVNVAKVTRYPNGPAGLIAVAPGTTRLFVDFIGMSGSREITVYSMPLPDPSIEIGEGSAPITFNVGERVSGEATADFPYRYRQVIPGDRWSIGDSTVATISVTWTGNTVELTGAAQGTTSVFIDHEGLRGRRSVTVLDSSAPRTGRALAGRWAGEGTNPDGSTYSICFFVAPDNKALTTLGSTCESSASLIVRLGSITNSRGAPCTVNILWTVDVSIPFEAGFRGEGSTRRFSGEFAGTATANGTAFWRNFTTTCEGSWSASPG